MTKLILMRHGESKWNQMNLFTGWVDIPLSTKGINEAIEGGKRIKDIPIDIIFTTSLIRAQMTAMLAMAEHHSGKVPVILHPGEGKLDEWAKINSESTKKMCIPVHCAWELNERMYGDLQGLNKIETAEQYGAEQVLLWRRSYDIAPPNGESLEMTAARSIPYFEEVIIPFLKSGKNIFVCAHGNSLRSIIMDMESLTKEQVLKLEIETGLPIVYNFENEKFTKT